MSLISKTATKYNCQPFPPTPLPTSKIIHINIVPFLKEFHFSTEWDVFVTHTTHHGVSPSVIWILGSLWSPASPPLPFNRRPFTAGARVHSQAGPCGLCNEQSATVVGFSMNIWFDSLDIIPPVLHARMFVYRRYKISAIDTVKWHTWERKRSQHTKKNPFDVILYHVTLTRIWESVSKKMRIGKPWDALFELPLSKRYPRP